MWDHNGENKTPDSKVGVISDLNVRPGDLQGLVFKRPPKIFLFNGPPGSGKDTAAAMMGKTLTAHQVDYSVYSFAAPLKRATHALFGVNAPEKAFEGTKDSPTDEFLGLSPREAYIKLSEEAVKPVWGNDFFANVAVSVIGRMKCHVVITDCGFQNELDVLADKLSTHRVILLKMFRNGHDYVRDSRSYVEMDPASTYHVHNNGSLTDLQEEINVILKEEGEVP